MVVKGMEIINERKNIKMTLKSVFYKTQERCQRLNKAVSKIQTRKITKTIILYEEVIMNERKNNKKN